MPCKRCSMSSNASPAADGQQNGFTQMPNSIFKATHLSHSARFLYNILLSYCWHKDYCFPSFETLMQDMQCGSQALTTYLAELKDTNLITIIRRGQGKTNLYYLTEVVQPAPALQEQQPEAAQASSLKIKELELPKSKTEEYKAEEYDSLSPDGERDDSNSRKAKNWGRDYVNSHSHTNQQQSLGPVAHQARVEQYRN